MKIEIAMQSDALHIRWPNEEQHAYHVPRENRAMVEHEIRDALADTMQDLVKRGLIKLAISTHLGEYPRRTIHGNPPVHIAVQSHIKFDNKSEEVYASDLRDRFMEEAGRHLAEGKIVHLTVNGNVVQTFKPEQFQSRRRLFNEGAGELQLGAGELQLEGAADLQLRAPERKALAVEHHFDPRLQMHSWIVMYDDSTTETITDACKARHIAETIYNV